MNELFTVKYDQLLTEFNCYVLTHPEFLAEISDEALIVLIDPKDPEFNRHNLERIQAYQRNDDKPDRPVIYIDIGELAPMQSRLVNPRVFSKLSDALVATF